MHPTLIGWLSEVSEAGISDAGTVNEVANNNLLYFSTTTQTAVSIGTSDTVEFLLGAFDIFNQRLSISEKCMCFYAWFDELSGQLRCSAAPASSPENLPFGCRLNVVKSPTSVAESFLHSDYLEGISLDGFEEVTDEMEQEKDEDDDDFILTVYARMID